MPSYLEPTGPIAPKALLTGDPKRAMEIANALLQAPRMSNLSRGLWGYYGTTEEGREVTVQSTGLGGTSAAIVAHELTGLGVREMIRIGSCVALSGEVEIGTVILAARGLPEHAGAQAAAADPDLLDRLRENAPQAREATVASITRYHGGGLARAHPGWIDGGALVADFGTSAVLETGATARVAGAAALIAGEDLNGQHLPREELEARLGELAGAALLALRPEPPQASSETSSRD